MRVISILNEGQFRQQFFGFVHSAGSPDEDNGGIENVGMRTVRARGVDLPLISLLFAGRKGLVHLRRNNLDISSAEFGYDVLGRLFGKCRSV